jgi:hypothetical protein
MSVRNVTISQFLRSWALMVLLMWCMSTRHRDIVFINLSYKFIACSTTYSVINAFLRILVFLTTEHCTVRVY